MELKIQEVEVQKEGEMEMEDQVDQE